MSEASITFEVPGRPRPWNRAEGKHGGGRLKHPVTKAYQERVQMAALQAGAAGFFAPKGMLLSMEIDVVLTSYRTCPDADNMIKLVMDALQVPKKLREGSPPPAALYYDDVQVKRPACRMWLDREGQSFMRVKVTKLPEGSDIWTTERNTQRQS